MLTRKNSHSPLLGTSFTLLPVTTSFVLTSQNIVYSMQFLFRKRFYAGCFQPPNDTRPRKPTTAPHFLLATKRSLELCHLKTMLNEFTVDVYCIIFSPWPSWSCVGFQPTLCTPSRTHQAAISHLSGNLEYLRIPTLQWRIRFLMQLSATQTKVSVASHVPTGLEKLHW